MKSILVSVPAVDLKFKYSLGMSLQLRLVQLHFVQILTILGEIP